MASNWWDNPGQSGYDPGNGGYAASMQQPDPNDGGGDGADSGQGPNEQKQACHASGGVWVGTGPYGQGYCKQPDNPDTGRADGCPEGQEKSPYDANGGDASYPLECVTSEEAQRRFDLRKSKNDSGSGSSSSSSSGGGGGKYTPTKSPYDAATSEAIYKMIMGIMDGKDLPFGPDTIARMQAAALQSNKGQLANARTDTQKRLIASGLSRSGVAPATYAKLDSAANVDLSNNLRTVATNAVQQNYSARMSALQQAQQFLQSERANSLSQDQLILSYARLNQEMKMQQAQFDQQWKIIQNGNEQEMVKLMLCLRTGVC